MRAKQQKPAIRQHYVPQFYLSGFTSPPENKLVTTLKKSDAGSFEGSFKSSTAKIGLEKHFYTLDNDYVYDNMLTSFEGDWSIVHRNILASKGANLVNNSEREKYAQFIAYQYVRTKRMRNLLNSAMRLDSLNRRSEKPNDDNRKSNKEIASSIIKLLSDQTVFEYLGVKNISEFAVKFNLSPELAVIRYKELEEQIHLQKLKFKKTKETGLLPLDYRSKTKSDKGELKDETKLVHLKQFTDYANFIEKYLINLNWVVLENPGELQLITSDNPVLVTESHFLSGINVDIDSAENISKLLGNILWNNADGKTNDELIVMMSLSPNSLLFCYHEGSKNKNIIDKFILSDFSFLFNHYLVFQAEEYLFGDKIDDELSNTIKLSNMINSRGNRLLFNKQ